MNVVKLVGRPSFRYLFAAIWLINGLWCKILGGVPRHEDIVGSILGFDHARSFTLAIGWAEVAMVVWIISDRHVRFCAYVQIGIILPMNVIESIIVPELLLWGRWNLAFAIVLCAFIHLHVRYRQWGEHA